MSDMEFGAWGVRGPARQATGGLRLVVVFAHREEIVQTCATQA
jgi:hypothetical protein